MPHLGDMNHIEPPEGFKKTSKSGASLLDLPMLIDNANIEGPEVLKSDKVVIHLGTNDISRDKIKTSQIMINCSKAINTTQNTFPDAMICLCSISPRKGSGVEQKRVSETAKTVNTVMKAMSLQSPEDIVFIYTWPALWNNKGSNAVKRFVSTQDTHGIHLIKDGKDLVISLVAKTPSHVGGKKRPLDPRVCTSPGTTEEATASVPSGNH